VTQQHDVPTADIGVTGLATMGRNLARNLASRGFTVAVHNRDIDKVRSLVAAHNDDGKFVPAETLNDFIASLIRPRRIIMMVKAGVATDAVIERLTPLLDTGDILVDAGNAHFADTQRRGTQLAVRGIHFVGAGVSGGEEGALRGPSIMPGGDPVAYAQLAPMLEAIAAYVDGTPCCTHVGPDGAGHFVKMVHNGIEYADMQLIGEAYQILRTALVAPPAQLAEIFARWNTTQLDSYLIQITAQVLARVDTNTGAPFIDIVRDEAEQKGTGGWTVETALSLGVPATAIAEAVLSRATSALTTQRELARAAFPTRDTRWPVTDPQAFIDDVKKALYASKIVAYAQGLDLVRAGSREYEWNISPEAIATIWRGGCIIRAQLLDRIREAYATTPDLPNLLFADYFRAALLKSQHAWRRVITHAIGAGVPVPAFSSTLAYFDSLRARRLPAALIQGQRDLFGAHTYQRTDSPGRFHVDWAGTGDERMVP
jgi:6-phosphogluconate dehydrogenase